MKPEDADFVVGYSDNVLDIMDAVNKTLRKHSIPVQFETDEEAYDVYQPYRLVRTGSP